MLNNLDDVTVSSTLVRLIVLRVSKQYAIHVRACILEQFVGAVEYDQSDFAVAKNAQFVRLLHQAKLPLRKCNLNNVATE